MFWHEGHGDPEPLPDGGGLHVRYVTVVGEQCVVLCGDDLGESRADRVVLATPRQVGAMFPLLKPRHWPRRVWMHGPELFRPGPVTARWEGEQGEVVREVQAPSLEWGTPWPSDRPEPPWLGLPTA